MKFRQVSNRSERVLKAAKLVYAKKQKSLLLPRNLALATLFTTKGKYAIPPLFNGSKVLHSASDKA